uniref:C-type lectin domain-containing protein n=1 Tax=Magallana gigas TaxID=29159 RepID=A0A8W8M1W3_MAGGI
MFSYILLWLTCLALSKKASVSLCGNNVTVLRVSARCYWMIQKPLNFTDAQRRCQDEGGILAEIPDKDAQEAINEKFPFFWYPHIWIGVNDIEKENNFVNMLNEAVIYTKWNSSEPNNVDQHFNNDSDCVKISSGFWHDASCSNTFPALCSKGQTIVSQTNEQTTALGSTRLTTKEQFRESETSVQTSIQSAETDPQSVPQTSWQAISSEQTTDTTSPVSQERECKCPCSRMKNLVIIKNEEELLTKIDNIKKELAVKKSLLSSSIRKKTSAVDPRPSASIVGGTISVVIIATVVGLIILSDLTRVINFCWKIISKRCNRKPRAAQKGMV